MAFSFEISSGMNFGAQKIVMYGPEGIGKSMKFPLKKLSTSFGCAPSMAPSGFCFQVENPLYILTSMNCFYYLISTHNFNMVLSPMERCTMRNGSIF